MIRIACLAACALALSACAALEPGRSMGRQLDDFNASLAVKSAMLRSEGYRLDQVDVEITEGVMLLTGSAPRDADRLYAECLAWSSPGVRSVANEIQVGEWRSPRELAQDQMITSQVRARLVRERSVRSVNYNIEAREAVVYLLGYARTRDEADAAAQAAALTSGVERVIDLVRVTGETPELPARGALRAEACDAAAGPPAPFQTAPFQTAPVDAVPLDQAQGRRDTSSPEARPF